MSQIFVIHDTSPSRVWINALLQANAFLLAQNNIHLGPFNPWMPNLLPTHVYFWNIIQPGTSIPADIADAWQKLDAILDAGKDVLLFTYHLDRGCSPSFSRFFKQYIASGKHNVKYLAIFGQPAVCLEQHYREAASPLSTELGNLYVDRLSNLSKLANSIDTHIQPQTLSFVANPQTSPISWENRQIAKKVSDFLNVELPCSLPDFPLHPLFYGSSTARCVASSHEVRYNAWPAMDVHMCARILKEVDIQWNDDRLLSPLPLRQELVDASTRDIPLIEELCGVESGTLAATERFCKEIGTGFYAPISEEHVLAFAAALPARERNVLKRRLDNDLCLLTPVQKTLRNLLKSEDSNSFTHVGEPEQPVKLTVLTMTYNHEKYIAECMNSVLAQTTNFPVRHIVLDHYSSDRTPDIISAYADKHSSIMPVLLSWRAPAENVYGLFSRCKSKYAALCDGDDYFTEPTKLQKQVDMLESNPNFGLCFHPVAAVFEDGRAPVIFPPLSTLPRRTKNEFYLADLMKCNFIQTNSAVYRWRFANGLPDWFRPDLCPGDWYWHMLHAETGKIGFIPEIMSVYRRHANALYANAFAKTTLALRREHGLSELETYKACNDHFQNRYFRNLSALATSVFGDFAIIADQTGDNTLFDAAIKRFPKFAEAFFHSLKKMNDGRRGIKRYGYGTNG